MNLVPTKNTKTQNQKPYERTNQIIENKRRHFFGPTKLLKIKVLPFYTNQIAENIALSRESLAKAARSRAGAEPRHPGVAWAI